MNPALQAFLATKQGHTQRAYSADLRDFFGGDLSLSEMEAFLSLQQEEFEQRLRNYERLLRARRLSEATITRRLVALRAFLLFAAKKGWATYRAPAITRNRRTTTLKDNSQPVESPDLTNKVQSLCAAPENANLGALRDTALLAIVCSCALNRHQICALNVGDWNETKSWLQVQPEAGEKQATTSLELFPVVQIPLQPTVNKAISDYLHQAGRSGYPTAPLFGTLSRRHGASGERLSVDGVYYLIRDYGQKIGWEQISSRLLRQIAIQLAWVKANHKLAELQQLLPHLSLETLLAHQPLNPAKHDTHGT